MVSVQTSDSEFRLQFSIAIGNVQIQLIEIEWLFDCDGNSYLL